MPNFMRPDSRQELQSFLSKAQDSGQSILPCGQGTRLKRNLPAANPDVWLSCSALQEILWIDAEDQTCCVEAGISLHALQQALAPFHLQLDVVAANARTGTLGGLFMAREESLIAGRSGPLRDHVLGATWMMADGSEVRSGARVVKSVAGYDVTRLLLGSRGRLAICLDLTLRLRPLRPGTVWITGLSTELHAKSQGQSWEFQIPHLSHTDWICCRLPHLQTDAVPATGEQLAECEAALELYLQEIAAGKHDSPLPPDSPWLAEIAEACAPGAPHYGARR